MSGQYTLLISHDSPLAPRADIHMSYLVCLFNTHLRIASAGQALIRCSSPLSPLAVEVVGTVYVVWRTNRRSGRGLIVSVVGRGMRVCSAGTAALGPVGVGGGVSGDTRTTASASASSSLRAS